MSRCCGETKLTKRSGETGEPCGVPMATGEKTMEEPWKRRRQVLPMRKDWV